MPKQVKIFQSFQNLDEYGNPVIPTDKMDELKRRWGSMETVSTVHEFITFLKLNVLELQH